MIVTYHEIVTSPLDYSYCVLRESFEEQVRILASLRAEGAIGLDAVTFDDGHSSHYEHAMPVLERHGLRGIFFVTTGWIGTRPGYMQWEQLKDAVARGHQVQSHTVNHAKLSLCTDSEMGEELLCSKETLEQQLGSPVDAVSAPGGRWDERVADRCRAAGYRRLFTSDPWLGPLEKHGLTYHGRFMMKRTMNGADIGNLLKARRELFHPLRVANAIKSAARMVAGDRLYQKTWEILSNKAAIR